MISTELELELLEVEMVPKTRAKFRCFEISKRSDYYTGNGAACAVVYAAKFNVVHGGSEENRQFWASSPNGVIELSTVREDHFEVGREYYVDFTAAPTPETS